MGIAMEANWPSMVILGGMVAFALWATQNSRHNHHPEYFALRLLLLAVSIWFLSFAVMYASNDPTTALFWGRLGAFGIAFVPAAVYSFAVSMFWTASPAFRRFRYRLALGMAWTVSSALALAALFVQGSLTTRLTVWDSFRSTFWTYYPHSGLLVYLLLAFTLIMVLLTFLHLWNGYRDGAQWRRLRTRRIMLALAIGSLAAVDSLPSLGVMAPPVGVIPLVIGLAIVVTTLRRYPAAYSTPPEPWNRVVNGINEALMYVGERGNIWIANKAALETFGLKKEMLGSALIHDLFPDYAIFSDPMALPSTLEGKTFEVTYRAKPDTYRVFAVHASPLYMGKNGPLNIVCMFEDVTARVEAERSLQESNYRLESALRRLEESQERAVDQERLRALGYVASGVAHELGNILTPILTFTEILRSSPDIVGTPKGARWLDTVYEAGLDARRTLTRLRSFYKKDDAPSGQQIVDVNKVIHDALAFSQPKWKDMAQAEGRTISVRLELGKAVPIHADPSDLREALVNLIFNAVDAMEKGGTLTLRTRTQNGGTTVEVQDTGIGMPEDIRRRAVEPFFSTKAEKGTGLGLPMVHNMVTQANGTLQITSRPGTGTTVALSFPPAPEEAPWLPKATRIEPVRRLRILVVDDDAIIHEAVSMFLQQDNDEVDAYSDPRDALEAFRRAPYDVVLTDWSMPDMNGKQFALAIKTLSPRTPVIMVTGFGEMGVVFSETPAGIEAVLSKPFTGNELRTAIRGVLYKEFRENIRTEQRRQMVAGSRGYKVG